jgi:hypothetical protein
MNPLTKLVLAATLPLTIQLASAADWYPSAYGPKDEIGAANLLTPEVIKQAVELVKVGKTYPLAVPKEEFPINQYMLAKRGIYNLELIDSRALVHDKAWEFLFVLGQPLHIGSTQVNVNPVAIR